LAALLCSAAHSYAQRHTNNIKKEKANAVHFPAKEVF